MNPRQRFVTSAVLGGAAGSLAMDAAQSVFAFALERDRAPDAQDEETEAISAVVGHLKRWAPALFGRADAPALGRAIHYVFGVGFAAAYLRCWPGRPPDGVRGAVFGTLLWLLSDRILIPSLKLGRPWARYSVAERSNALVSHLAYALVVELARERPAL